MNDYKKQKDEAKGCFYADNFIYNVMLTSLEEASESFNSYSYRNDFIDILADELAFRLDNPMGYFSDLACGGCSSGIVTDLIYYEDTKKLYISHVDDIELRMDELGDEYGSVIKLDAPRYNSAVWCAFEEFASCVSNDFEEVFRNSLEDELSDLELTDLIEVYKEFKATDYNDVLEYAVEERLVSLEDEISTEQLQAYFNDDDLDLFHDRIEEILEEREVIVSSSQATPLVPDIVTEARAKLGEGWDKPKTGEDKDQKQHQEKSKGMKL